MSKYKPQDNVISKKAAVNAALSDKNLAEQVTTLPNEMAPERDLWPGIERAINNKSQTITADKQGDIFVPSAWAASIAVVILMSWFTFTPSNTEHNVPALVKTPAESSIDQGTLVDFMQKNFQQQKQTLLVSYGQPTTDQLPPAMQKRINAVSGCKSIYTKSTVNG